MTTLFSMLFWVAFGLLAFAAWFYARQGLSRLNGTPEECTDPVMCLFPNDDNLQRVGYQVVIAAIAVATISAIVR